MSTRAFVPTSELRPATTWLLEASAGTGKTFQVAGLYARLVAEYDVPVEKILAITFTEAATAELRDRIRRRLRATLDALRASPAASDDEVIAHLRALPDGARATARLERALRSFDIAPISTIHGFSQRMLQELAFDSGQDTGLELLTDTRRVVGEIVDDALATLYAGASVDELSLFGELGVTRKNLLAIAQAVGGATRPEIAPAPVGDLDACVGAARVWLAKVARVRAAFGPSERAALLADAKLFKSGQASHFESSLRALDAWLAKGAAEPRDEAQPSVRRLLPSGAREKWSGERSALEARAHWGAMLAHEALLAEQGAALARVSPLAVFASTIRPRVEAELDKRRLLTFDAMLSRLAERVEADGGGASPIAERVRARFDAVFVDEFQDTDAAQWTVIEAAFHGHARLFLIGDPKQAIYAFRGADVHVYLDAKASVPAETQRTMTENWRSDPNVVEAMNALFREGSRAFDQPGDGFDYVRVAPRKPARLSPPLAGLELRWLDARARGGDEGEPIGRKDVALAARVGAREALAWLEGGRAALVEETTKRERAVEPGDLAVLVDDRYQAAAVRRALAKLDVPSVAASKASVFETPVAEWLAAWLVGVAGAGRDRAARTAAVTPLFGFTADELAWALAVATRGDEARDEARAAGVVPRDWDAWTERLHAAAARWPSQGFARTFEREAGELDVFRRVLALPDGERHATDLRHLFELLHVEDRTHRPGPAALATWLGARKAEMEDDGASQRLESDARAVKIETVHASKGLEYPVVLLPFAWAGRAGKGAAAGPIVLREGGRTTVDLHPNGSDERAGAVAREREESRREALRRAYVALTRARHQTVAWYGPIGQEGAAASATPLGRLLMRDPRAAGFDDGEMPKFEKKAHEAAWNAARARLDELVERSNRAVAWRPEAEVAGGDGAWSRAGDARSVSPVGATWPKGRDAIGTAYVVTSYSGLAPASAAHDRDEKATATVAVENARPSGDDAPEADAASLDAPEWVAFAERPRLEMGRGTEYGTWVHGVLERTEFATGASKPGEPDDAIGASAAALGFDPTGPVAGELRARLGGVLATPLDAEPAPDALGLPRGFALASICAADRLDELRFDLRLGEGSAWRREPGARAARAGSLDLVAGCVDPTGVYDAIASTAGVRGRGFAAWLEALRARRDAKQALVASVSGILTGSIDLVFRVRDERGTRHYLADYKTNRVETSNAGHYAFAWLDRKMATSGYYLQSLIYTLALHRHLGCRLGARYDYERDVGGALYLFLRGMSGPDTPRDPESGRCLGVHAMRWPASVVVALDQALGGVGRPSR